MLGKNLSKIIELTNVLTYLVALIQPKSDITGKIEKWRSTPPNLERYASGLGLKVPLGESQFTPPVLVVHSRHLSNFQKCPSTHKRSLCSHTPLQFLIKLWNPVCSVRPMEDKITQWCTENSDDDPTSRVHPSGIARLLKI